MKGYFQLSLSSFCPKISLLGNKSNTSGYPLAGLLHAGLMRSFVSNYSFNGVNQAVPLILVGFDRHFFGDHRGVEQLLESADDQPANTYAGFGQEEDLRIESFLRMYGLQELVTCFFEWQTFLFCDTVDGLGFLRQQPFVCAVFRNRPAGLVRVKVVNALRDDHGRPVVLTEAAITALNELCHRAGG